MSQANAEENGPLLLSIATVALTLGLSRWQVRGLTKDGDLQAAKVRGRIYIPAESVREYVAELGKTA